MADIAFVAIALAFFGLAYLYVLGCDRIIGRDLLVEAASGAPAGVESAPAVGDVRIDGGAER